MSFVATIRSRSATADSMLCVGLDPFADRLPACVAQKEDAYFAFCRAIVDATAPWACAFKPQIACFAAAGQEAALTRVIAYIHEKHPGIAVILDAKRGDIGSTAKKYAQEAFVRYGADAVTVSPYMGFDTIEPYTEYEGRGVIVLCRTSNPGGADIEELKLANGQCVYEHVAELAETKWNACGEMGLVVGATHPEEIARVRAIAPSLPLLVPGIGAQGGNVELSVKAGLDAHGWGMIINSSRAILYAGSDENFAQAAAAKAKETCEAIRAARPLCLK